MVHLVLLEKEIEVVVLGLTAYATRAFSLAKKYIFIDPEVLNKALEWIIQKQSSDGSFEEPGEVHHKSICREELKMELL
ncbi:CD109 antigen [Caerostris extrusa]|uniref:CD109 antigen n=1 Tax=Caerostris extrusa TaxID=172846 RepID=A0AAV4XY10_CAEEX|nr:CD109 antigen [Caerostris extrusa]